MATIIIGLIFAVVFILAARKVYNDAKNKKCSCGCSACSNKSKCCK